MAKDMWLTNTPRRFLCPLRTKPSKIRWIMDISQELKWSNKFRQISRPTEYNDKYGWIIGDKRSLKK